ncbi:hypothetical protein HFP57_05935 [Parasphingopyxis algicola]|uniref:hypothetical protein n=1 Tax=Parasphingopyxis algicola TaxID=2026624 RepID=UPI0015A002E4|nr:hypothetical protein [Parasphingopyxis algicola]QLC24613.1 hypothetical protein HFP57_05935 [Parasphingopyxis algicola]
MFKEIALMGAAALVAAAGFGTNAFGGGEPEAVEGRIYHYVRSNQDGSGAENVYVYRAASNRLEVYKARERCTDAAFVTAWVDAETGRAAVVNGGRLMPEARHENFATIAYDGAATMLRAEAALPDRMVRQQVRVEEPIFHLYDFDLATLSLQTMALDDPRSDFSFGLPLIWTEPEDGRYVRHLGRADAEYVGEEDYRGTAALRFEVGGPALGDKGGPLWIDANSGHVLGAQWGIPNHAGMDDFAIRLAEIEDSGDAGWQALLTAHFEGCPTV